MLLYSSSREPGTGRSIAGLVEELLGHAARLLDQKLVLLRLEIEDSLGTLMRHVAALLIGAVLAGLGLVLSSIALALWIGSHVHSTAAGFALTGAGFLVAGAALIGARLLRGVGPKRALQSHTMKELEKDSRWVKSEF